MFSKDQAAIVPPLDYDTCDQDIRINTEHQEEKSCKSKKKSKQLQLKPKISYERSKSFTNCNIYAFLKDPDTEPEELDETKDILTLEKNDETECILNLDETKHVKNDKEKQKKKK